MSTAALHQAGSLPRRSSQQQTEEEEWEKEKRLEMGLVHYLKWNNHSCQQKKAHPGEGW